MIVDDERDVGRRCNRLQLRRECGCRVATEILCAQLDDVDTARDQLARDTRRVGRRDVSQIEDAVEPTAAEVDRTQRVRRYSCSRVGVGFSSKLSEVLFRRLAIAINQALWKLLVEL